MHYFIRNGTRAASLGLVFVLFLSINSEAQKTAPAKGIAKATATLPDVKVIDELALKGILVPKDKPLLVNFWATWCGPCQFMLPIFDKLAKKYDDKVSFGRLNVDDNQGIAMRFDVYAIPTFIVFMNGKAVDKAVGAVGEKGLEGLLEKYQ